MNIIYKKGFKRIESDNSFINLFSIAFKAFLKGIIFFFTIFFNHNAIALLFKTSAMFIVFKIGL